MNEESLSIEVIKRSEPIKVKTYSYRDMLDAWVAGRKNLVEWGVGEGDKPDFASWIQEKFGDTSRGAVKQKL